MYEPDQVASIDFYAGCDSFDIECQACGVTYTQKGKHKPRSCGLCGSKDIWFQRIPLKPEPAV